MIDYIHPGRIVAEREFDKIVAYCRKHYGFVTQVADEMTRLSAVIARQESKRIKTKLKQKVWSRQEVSVLLTPNKERRVEPAYGTGKLLIAAVNNLKKKGK